MKDLLVRSFSGLFYVLLILSTLFIGKVPSLIIFGALGVITLREFLNLIDKQGQSILYPALYFILFLGLISLYSRESTIFAPLILIISCIFNSFLAYQLFTSRELTYSLSYKLCLSILYLIGGIIFMTGIAYTPINMGYNPKLLVAIFLLIWANDSFAYLVGVKFGKRKLFPSVSPKKSIEGFIGGLAGAILVGIIISYTLYSDIALTHWIVIGIMAGALGTIGDLIQSKLKRKAGVKDSGKIMPGHGGMYDRLDSIIYASPFIFAYLYFVI